MKLLVVLTILLTSFTALGVTSSTRSDIRISIEDTTDLNAVDYDANDVVFCSNWNFQSDSNDLSVHRVTVSITPIAAGAQYDNAVYIRNPCNGPAEIELKKPEDACGADSVIETVAQGEMTLWTSSFTQNSFSSSCGSSMMINVGGNEVCSPNKSYVVIECQGGSEIDLSVEPDNEFPFAKIFHVDAKADGTDAGNDSDDINSDTLFGGLATIIVGHCDDPVSMEKNNLIDALNVRNSLNANDCANNAETCRNAIKSVLTSHRTAGWGNIANVRKRNIKRDHGLSFSPKAFITNNMFSRRAGNAGRRKNPIFNEDANECSSENNQDSYVYVSTPASSTIPPSWENQSEYTLTQIPSAYINHYFNRSDVNGTGVIGIGGYSNVFRNKRVDFSNLTRVNIYHSTALNHMNTSYCVYNGSECPSGTQSFQNGSIKWNLMAKIGTSWGTSATWSSKFVPIAADATIGTSAFCISQKNIQTSGTKVNKLTNGNRFYDLCKGHTSASDEEKAKYAMITFDQYNALIRSWEQQADNYTGGVVGSGHIFMTNYQDVKLLSGGGAVTATTNCSDKVEDGFLSIKTKVGDYVMAPVYWTPTCTDLYKGIFIMDFSGDDNQFTEYTEDLPNRTCNRVTSNSGNKNYRVHRLMYGDSSNPNKMQLYTYGNNTTSTSHKFTLPESASNKNWLHTDATYTTSGGAVIPVTPGSKCPKINSVNDYEFN